MIVRCDYRFGAGSGSPSTLAAAQLVRSVTLWTVGVVLFALRSRPRRPAGDRRRIRKALVVASVTAARSSPLPWYMHLQVDGSNAVFGRR